MVTALNESAGDFVKRINKGGIRKLCGRPKKLIVSTNIERIDDLNARKNISLLFDETEIIMNGIRKKKVNFYRIRLNMSDLGIK